jgi:hypothetical protein
MIEGWVEEPGTEQLHSVPYVNTIQPGLFARVTRLGEKEWKALEFKLY